MAVTIKEVIYLGTFADADTDESTASVENTSIYLQTFGSAGSPLSNSIEDMIFRETAEMQLRGLCALEEALQFMPERESAAFYEARKRVPFLVEIESNPLRFLSFERYNAWSAARRRRP